MNDARLDWHCFQFIARLIRDDWVSESLTAADLAALAEQEYVRSQHVPLVSFAGTPYWREVNLPRTPRWCAAEVKSGAWYGLDWSLRNLVNREAAVYVYTGAIFDPEAEPLLTEDSGYRIPDKFQNCADRRRTCCCVSFSARHRSARSPLRLAC